MITKDNNLKVMELFFKFPYSSFHIREIARLTELSSTGIIKIIRKLKKEDLLISKKAKMVEEVSPNFDGRFVLVKRLYNIYSLTDSGLLVYLKKFYELPQAIILFGSYSNGTDSEKSDIDLAILSKKKDIPDLTIYEKRLKRKISLHLIDLDKTSNEFKNTLANGVIVEGYIELIK